MEELRPPTTLSHYLVVCNLGAEVKNEFLNLPE